MDYRVSLDMYKGPMDLLLYLIRENEVDIYDIPVAQITDQYMKYLDVLKLIDPNVVGDFLVLAATLAALTGYTLTRGVLCAMHRPALRSVAEVTVGATRVATARRSRCAASSGPSGMVGVDDRCVASAAAR